MLDSFTLTRALREAAAHLHETTVTGLTDSIDFTIREADDLLTGLRSLREDLD